MKNSELLVLLWTNEKTESDFGPQTMTMDLSEFEYLLVSAIFIKKELSSITESNIYTSLIRKGDDRREITTVDPERAAAYRDIRFSDDCIEFFKGQTRNNATVVDIMLIVYQLKFLELKV